MLSFKEGIIGKEIGCVYFEVTFLRFYVITNTPDACYDL
jgi:hypothetical protein